LTDKNSWSKATIASLSWDVHAKLRTFTETVGELIEGEVVLNDNPLLDEYDDVIHAEWALHNYLYPEEQ